MKQRTQAGFTLVEVLVAVAILATALGAIIVAGSRYADNAAYLRNKTIANWVAHNVLNEWHISGQFPDIGEKTGEAEQAGQEWEWLANVSKTPDDDIRRVDVSVRLADRDEDEKLVTVSGFLAKE